MDDWGAIWLEKGFGVRPESAADVLAAVSRLSVLSSSTPYVWRGVSRASHSVQPSVFRVPEFRGVTQVDEKAVSEYETRVLREANSWGVGHGSETFPTFLSALATIQHHASTNGSTVPTIGTRLLDVSSEPLTALWFATKTYGQPRGRIPDGVVLAIRSDVMPVFGTHSSQRGTSDAASGLEGGWSRLSRRGGGAFVVRPEFPSPRMAAQNSLFLASKVPKKQRWSGLAAIGIDGLDLGVASGIRPLTDNARDFLLGASQTVGRPQRPEFTAIIVPGDIKDRLREALQTTYGRTESAIFPDVQGFVEHWRPHSN